MTTPDPFRVRLLSEFGLERDGEAVHHFNANRPELLLMYMAVAPDTWHLRRSVATDIWPTTDVATARKHLSYNLFLLKKITSKYGLVSPFEETRHSLRLRPELGLDTRDFLSALSAAGAATTVEERLRGLETALECYGQGLLPSHRQPWLTAHQQRFEEMAESARQMMAIALPAPARVLAGHIGSLTGQVGGIAGAWTAGGPADAAPPGSPALPGEGMPDILAPAAPTADDAPAPVWTLGSLARWAAEAEVGVAGAERETWLARFDDLYPTIHTSLDRAITQERAIEALPIPAALWEFYYRRREFLPEGRRQLDHLLAHVRSAPPLLHARALHASGTMAYFDGDREVARRQLEKALARWRALKEPGKGLLRTLGNLAIVLQGLNELERAGEIYGQCIAMARRLDEPKLLSTALYNAAQNEIRRRDGARARSLIEQRQELLAEHPDIGELARTYGLLSAVDILLDNLDDARHGASVALSLYESAGDIEGRAHSLRLLGQIALRQGEYDESQARYDESLAIAEEIRSFWQVGLSLGGLAVLYRTRGEEAVAKTTFVRATALLRAAEDEESVRRLAAEFAAHADSSTPAVRRRAGRD
ncbi:MAG: tetratricopeptide repeat protein [Ardenticatenales bacterium]